MTTSSTDSPGALARSPRRIAIASALAIGFVIPATTVGVYISLPSIVKSLNLTMADAQLVVVAYSMTSIASLLPAGYLADRVGRVGFLTAAASLFFLGGLIAHLADSLRTLLIGRCIQAIGASASGPAALSFLYLSVPDEMRAKAVAWWGMLNMSSMSVAGVLSGALNDAFGWRAAFLIPAIVPLIAAIPLVTTIRARGAESSTARPVDIPSMGALLLASVGAGGLFGVGLEWHNPVFWGLLATMALGGVLLYSRRAVPSSVLANVPREPLFGWALILQLLFSVTNSGFNFILPIYTQTVHAFSATQSGWVLTLQFAIGFVAHAIASTFVSDSRLTKLLLRAIPLMICAACTYLLLDRAPLWLSLLAPQAVRGAAGALAVLGIRGLAQRSAGRHQAVGASTVMLANHLGIAVGPTIAAASLHNAVGQSALKPSLEGFQQGFTTFLAMYVLMLVAALFANKTSAFSVAPPRKPSVVAQLR